MIDIKEMSIEEIESKYGKNLAKKLIENINSSKEIDIEYLLHETERSEYLTTVVFSTRSYCYIYTISTERKRIIFEDNIGYEDCLKVLELMKKARKKQQARQSSLH